MSKLNERCNKGSGFFVFINKETAVQFNGINVQYSQKRKGRVSKPEVIQRYIQTAGVEVVHGLRNIFYLISAEQGGFCHFNLDKMVWNLIDIFYFLIFLPNFCSKFKKCKSGHIDRNLCWCLTLLQPAGNQTAGLLKNIKIQLNDLSAALQHGNKFIGINHPFFRMNPASQRLCLTRAFHPHLGL